jgi:hypothetical protein
VTIALWEGIRPQPQLGAEALLVQHVTLKPGTTGNERQVQGPGQEPEAHVEVGVVLHLHVSELHRLAEPDTGGRETTGAAVGQLQAAHHARPDQEVHGLAVRVHHEVQLSAALADDFARDDHGVAVGREAPQGDHVPVFDKAPHSLLGAHPLVLQINAGHWLASFPLLHQLAHLKQAQVALLQQFLLVPAAPVEEALARLDTVMARIHQALKCR